MFGIHYRIEISCKRICRWFIKSVGPQEKRSHQNLHSNSHILHPISKSQDHTSPVTTLRFNPSETHIVSGSANGQVFLHSLMNNQSVASFDTNQQSIRDLRYSPYRKSLLAGCTDDGTIPLFLSFPYIFQELYIYGTQIAKLYTLNSNNTILLQLLYLFLQSTTCFLSL